MMQDILFTQEGQIGFITLNRPQALNALTHSMVTLMQQQLTRWSEDGTIFAIVVQAYPGNAFCAGGDIRGLYQSGKDNSTDPLAFFWDEYRLNYFINQLKKPYIALMNGVTMGGGVGISLHGSHPIATERFVFAMPETSIGFFPDIGASRLLNRCPGALGMYLGLTGNRLGPEASLQAGLIKGVISSQDIERFIEDLHARDLSRHAHAQVDACMASYASAQSFAELSDVGSLMESCFSQPTIEAIEERLRGQQDDWSCSVLNTLAQKSPLSLKVTQAQLQKTKALPLSECLKIDYDLVAHFMVGTDFYEGVRALLIDKDKNPKWNPPRLDLVSQDMVDHYFKRTTELMLDALPFK